MAGWGRTFRASGLMCAAAFAFAGEGSLGAQTLPPPSTADEPSSSDLDPSAPLAPLPDIGVEWPDLNAPDADESSAEGEQTNAVTDAGVGERRYSFEITGLNGIGDSADMLATFRKQSALEGGRKKPANVAQVSRRSQADSDLLA